MPVRCSTGCSCEAASGPSTSCSSRASCPQEASRRLSRQPRRRVLGAAVTRRRRAAIRSHSAGDGCSRNRCTSRCSASARSTLQVAGGQPREPEQREARRQVDQVRLRAQPRAGALAAARPGRARRSASRSRRHSSACQCPSAPPPSRAPAPAGAARSGRRGRRGGGRRRSGARGWSSGAAASEPSHGSSSASSTTSSSGHTSRSGSHGSVSGSIPDAAATASPVSRRGDGNSTLAQIPERSSGQPLREPALHPARGHRDDLGRERVGRRRRRAARAARRRGRRPVRRGGRGASGPDGSPGRNQPDSARYARILTPASTPGARCPRPARLSIRASR